MRKLLALLIVVMVATAAIAQQPKPPGYDAWWRFNTYRLRETEPSYGLKKVKQLIKQIKADSEDNQRLTPAAFNRLSVPERFTYTMIHPEDFSQNCDAVVEFPDERKMIYGYLPSPGDRGVLSANQIKFLHDHRFEVVKLLRETITRNHDVGINLKRAIVEVKAYELIPTLVTTYRKD